MFSLVNIHIQFNFKMPLLLKAELMICVSDEDVNA